MREERGGGKVQLLFGAFRNRWKISAYGYNDYRQEREMNTVKRTRKVIAGTLAGFVLAVMCVGMGALSVQAASGTVYTCVIHPCYAHPVTGVIEDSGGEASYTTGQGMVEGAIYTTGILELTDSGEYYLTIRMSLMDYTSNHNFWVQNVGDSDWFSPGIGVTGNGTDSNGTTADLCIQVTSENCVVRGSMYVEPMGRDVIFYLYPSDYTEGNDTDMKPTIITAASGSGGTSERGSTSESGNSTASGSGSASFGSSLQSSSGLTASGASDAANKSTGGATPELSNSITENAEPEAGLSKDSTLSDMQGLSLSTAENETSEEAALEASGKNGVFATGVAVTVSGLILMIAAAMIVYFFRKNWKRWGGGYEDDEI